MGTRDIQRAYSGVIRGPPAPKGAWPRQADFTAGGLRAGVANQGLGNPKGNSSENPTSETKVELRKNFETVSNQNLEVLQQFRGTLGFLLVSSARPPFRPIASSRHSWGPKGFLEDRQRHPKKGSPGSPWVPGSPLQRLNLKDARVTGQPWPSPLPTLPPMAYMTVRTPLWLKCWRCSAVLRGSP